MGKGANGLKKSYWLLVQGENFLRHVLLLFIRLYWGGLLVMTGVGKFTNIDGVSHFFETLHIPAPTFMAYLVAGFELLGGISLIAGFFSRIFALCLSITFFTAYATAHHEALVTLFKTPSLFISAEPFLFLYAVLVVLCFGPGLFSFDYWFEKKAFGKPL